MLCQGINIFFFRRWTSKIIIPSPRNPPYLRKRKQNTEAVLIPRRSLQYCQFADKNSRYISRNIWNFSKFPNFYLSFYWFLRTPKRCFADPWLGNSALCHTSCRLYVTEWCSVWSHILKIIIVNWPMFMLQHGAQNVTWNSQEYESLWVQRGNYFFT